jgi:hypothetical protein
MVYIDDVVQTENIYIFGVLIAYLIYETSMLGMCGFQIYRCFSVKIEDSMIQLKYCLMTIFIIILSNFYLARIFWLLGMFIEYPTTVCEILNYMPGLILMGLGMTICYYWTTIFIRSNINFADVKKLKYGRIAFFCYISLVTLSLIFTLWIIIDFYSYRYITRFDYLWQNLYLLNFVLCLLITFTLLFSGRRLSEFLICYAYHENGPQLSSRVLYI